MNTYTNNISFYIFVHTRVIKDKETLQNSQEKFNP